jgi:hypothetical protein
MSSLQNINGKTISLSDKLSSISAGAASWATSLKLRQALFNVLVLMPILAVPWLLGRLFFYAKYLLGLLYFGFKQGAKME